MTIQPVLLTDVFENPLSPTINERGELRVAQLASLLAIKQVGTALDPTIVCYHTANTGAVTYEQANSSTVLSTGANANGLSLMQSRWYVNYQSGRRQVPMITGCPLSMSDGALWEMGYFDDSNGFFLRVNDGGKAWLVARAYGSEVAVPQDRWNVDPFDGTGPSGVKLDPFKAHRWFARFAWLGVGDAEVGFVQGKYCCVAHRFDGINRYTKPYMATPSLPLRWRISGPNSSGRAICGDVGSETAQTPQGVPQARERLTSLAVSAGTTRALVSIRLASGVRQTVFPGEAAVACASNDTGTLRLLWNPTFDAPTGWVAPTGEAVDYNISGRLVTDPGKVLASMPFSTAVRSAHAELDKVLVLAADYAGTGDVITAALTAGASNITSLTASLTYRVVP